MAPAESDRAAARPLAARGLDDLFARRQSPRGGACGKAQSRLQERWELLPPAVAFAALFSGLATAVEAAALTAFYVLVVEVVLHRDLHSAS